MIDVVDILYMVVIVAVIVITITLVWLANELIGLTKSLRRSAEDTETMTSEIKEKVHLISEALDRVGTASTRIIGIVEDGVETIRERKDQLANSIGLISGVGEYYKRKKESQEESVKESKKTEEVKSESQESEDKEKPEKKEDK